MIHAATPSSNHTRPIYFLPIALSFPTVTAITSMVAMRILKTSLTALQLKRIAILGSLLGTAVPLIKIILSIGASYLPPKSNPAPEGEHSLPFAVYFLYLIGDISAMVLGALEMLLASRVADLGNQYTLPVLLGGSLIGYCLSYTSQNCFGNLFKRYHQQAI